MHDPPRAAQATASEQASAPFVEAPPLSLLTALAALLHLLTYRVFVPVLAVQRPLVPTALLSLGPFLLNLAACAGMVAWAVSAFALVRSRTTFGSWHRATVAALAAILLTTLAIATFASEARLPVRLVLVGAAATHLLAIQMSRGAFAHESAAAKTTAALIAITSLLSLGGVFARELGSSPGTLLSLVLGVGELAYLAMPIAAAFVVVPWSERPLDKRARTYGTIAAAVVGCAFAVATRLPAPLYRHILFSTWRLEWALDKASLGYAVPISLACGAAIAALTSPSARHRQGGIGILLWLSAGYNPLTPIRMLIACLGAALMTRTLIGLRNNHSSSGPIDLVGGTYR